MAKVDYNAVIPTVDEIKKLIEAKNDTNLKQNKKGNLVKASYYHNDFAIAWKISVDADCTKCVRYLIIGKLIGWDGLVQQLTRTCGTLKISKTDLKTSFETIKAHSKEVAETLKSAGITESLNITEDTKKIKDHKWENKGDEGSHGTFRTKHEADNQRKAMFANGYHEELSITEDIEKHNELNPKLFKDNKLKPEVRTKILEIGEEFIKKLAEDEVKILPTDIYLVGSNASYNYTKDSDCDLHIIVGKIDCPDNLYPKLYSAYRSIFNKNMDIDFYGIPVELYVETIGDPLASNGIYSVRNDKWVKEPVQQDIPEINHEEFEAELMTWEDRYQNIKDSDNPTEQDIDQYLTDIYELRHAGLAKDGEYSIGNLVFKEVRNKGWLDKLKEMRTDCISDRLSLEGLMDKQAVKDQLTENTGYLTNKQIYEYKAKIARATYEQPLISQNGLFEIYNVRENDVQRILGTLRNLDFIEEVSSSASGKYDFSHMGMNTLPSRYYMIRGRIKID